MQFIKNGPNVPDHLLQAHEEGRVVFFCGAGISYPARLPGFEGLVDGLYEGLNVEPDPVEDVAIKNRQYDTAIGLLEGRITGGRARVREQLVQILTPDLCAPRATATHEALLILAKTRATKGRVGRYRLVTTNFDRLFEKTIAKKKLQLERFAAPLLPIPKSRFDGLVYLHGLLSDSPTEDELDRLVVSSGDFGLAYLTERWAARFVSELFGNYTVCFVGYSIDDPVLRYVMDALATDRRLGESHPKAFAFGSYRNHEENQAANEWKAKNVAPILYRETPKHTYLHRTLKKWAGIYRDGISGKERIVHECAKTNPLPGTQQDDFVGRLLWALNDREGAALPAMLFADLDPAPSFDWLEHLTEQRFGHEDLTRFGIQPNNQEDTKLKFSLVERPTPYTYATWMSLVNTGSTGAGKWDPVMRQLARWLVRHIDEPKLILWVARQGGVLHPEFAELVEKELNEKPPSPSMQTLWRLALSGRLEGKRWRLELYGWQKRFKRDGLTPTIRLKLRELLSPRVHLTEPFCWIGTEKSTAKASDQTQDLVDWEIILPCSHVHSALKNISQEAKWQEALPELLSDATGLLCDTLDLMRELGRADDQSDESYRYQPSIKEHPQNRDSHDWTVLIDLARDAWMATASKDTAQARLEIQRWLRISYPLFRRLVFFAATETSLFTPRQALQWLLADKNWWLWSVETRRESFRLLVAIGPKLNDPEKERLERAILKGPPRRLFRNDIEPKRLQQRTDWEIWLRLAKCSAAGVHLGSNAIAKLQSLSGQHREWELAPDERDEFPIWIGTVRDAWQEFVVTPERYIELVEWLRQNPRSIPGQEDDWRDRCKRDPRQTASALRRVGKENEWLVYRWRQALEAWSDENVQGTEEASVSLAARSFRWAGAVLATAPDDVVREIALSMGLWLQSVAKSFGKNSSENTFFALIRRILVLYKEDSIESEKDPVYRSHNHPIGRVTEAALRWWYEQSPKDSQKLTPVLKPLFSDICDTNIESYRLGRIRLAAHVIPLFRVDREWADQFLLPLFEWLRLPVEARSAWESFLWSARLYLPLIEALKREFLATAQHYAELGECRHQYAALLTFAALEATDTFTKPELANATLLLPEDGLQHTAETLAKALEWAGDERAEYWHNRVRPYLKSIWPKAEDLATSAISEILAKLCIKAQDDFPEAQQVLKTSLQPVEDPSLLVHLFSESGLCGRFPEESLNFLDILIPVGEQRYYGLRDCLDAIQSACPELQKDSRFDRLRGYNL